MAEWCSAMWINHFVYLFIDESLVDSLSWLVWKCSYKHESRSLFNILVMLPGDTHARAGFLGCVVPLILGFWESSVLYFTSPPAMCKRRCLSLHRHQHLTVSHLFSLLVKRLSLCCSGWPGTHHVDQANLKLKEICLLLPLWCCLPLCLCFLSAEVKAGTTTHTGRRRQLLWLGEYSCHTSVCMITVVWDTAWVDTYSPISSFYIRDSPWFMAF